jgi:hypothetical protein
MQTSAQQSARYTPPATEELLSISPFQERVCLIPEQVDVFMGGGRGGAKSYGMAVLTLRHIEQYKQRARVLYLRQTHRGCADFAEICVDLFGTIYGKGLRHNSQAGTFKFPDGGVLEINQLETAADYKKFQGRSFTLLLQDEAGQYAVPDMLDKVRSNLRGPKDMPIRTIVAANPGDAGHQWIAARYVFKSAPWTVFREDRSGRLFVYAPSTFLDNPFIDQDEYKKQLESSCPGDPELLRAWLEGDWSIARGAFFGGCIEEARNAVGTWDKIPKGWEHYLSHDYGSDAPSVTYLVVKSPGGTGPDNKFYPRDSLILIDEFATNQPGNVSKGMGWTVPTLAGEIRKHLCEPWKVSAVGVADDACFAAHGHSRGSIAQEFARERVTFFPAKKADRITGWTRMRTLLGNAGKPDVPGMYISRRCAYFWQTVPYLARDDRRAEDLDSRGPDHAADAARYACFRELRQFVQKAMW